MVCNWVAFTKTTGIAKTTKIYAPILGQPPPPHSCSCRSASPKPHSSKPHPCNMPQAKTEVALQFSECCAAGVALQHSLFCNADVIVTKSCTAASEKLQCNIEKAALQESGALLLLSCGFQAPTLRYPRLGPADANFHEISAEFPHLQIFAEFPQTFRKHPFANDPISELLSYRKEKPGAGK